MDEYEPDMSEIAEDECCICGSYEVRVRAPFGYPFCGEHDHRAFLIRKGKEYHWPALRTAKPGVPGYALDNDMESWLITALIGTDDRVFAFIEAIGEYEESQERLAS